MKYTINNLYTILYRESAEFRSFVIQMEKYTTDEIKAEYGVNNEAIFDFLKKQSSK